MSKLNLKSRVDIINKEKEDFINSINVLDYFDDSNTLQSDTQLKTIYFFDKFGDEKLVDKFLNETPNEYKRKLNYYSSLFFHHVKPKNLEQYILKFIDVVDDKINNYGMDKIMDEVYLNNLNKDLIFNKLKQINEEMFNEVLRLNYWYKKNTLKENLNLKSRVNDIKKDREELINGIFDKGIENLGKEDFIIIERLDEEKRFYLELKKYLDTLNIPSVLTSLMVEGMILKINEHFFLKLFYGKLKLWLISRIKNEKLSDKFFELPITHKVEQDFRYLNFNNTKDLIEVLELLNDYAINEGLNLKSRAKEQEQGKEEFINNILSKGIRNLSGNDFAIIIKLDETKKELFFNELIKEFGEDFDYEIDVKRIIFRNKKMKRRILFVIPYRKYFDFSYNTLERMNLPNGVSFNTPNTVFDSVETFDELIKKGHEILNKPMVVENLNESNSRQEKLATFANKVAEKMGINTINYLDSGFFGSAFDIGDNKILKITTDKSEALNAKKVKGKDTHFIAKVYDVRGFKFEGVEYYFIILEKVQTDYEYLNGIIENLISWFDENNDEDFIDFITGSEFENLKEIKVDLYNDNKQLYNYFTNFVELKKELIKYNITSSDFINGTNLGFRGKRIVAFDLGISDDDGELENFDLFEGINLRSRAKDIEKEKEELSKEILQKNIEDFTKNDVQFLISTDNFENFLGKLKLYFDEFFKNEKHESLIKSSAILPVLKLKLIDRPRLGYNNILHIGFDILFKNQFYVEKFDGIVVDSGRYFDNIKELLDYVKDTYKKKIYESLNLKSKAKEHEKEGLDFYINKIKGNETLYFIPENIFKNLPNDVKLKYIDKMVNEVGYKLYQNEFDDSPDEIKIKYIEMIKDKGWNLSEYEKKWVEENKEKLNFEIKEGLNLKSRAKDNKEELFSFLREKGINDYTLSLLDKKEYKDLPKDIQSMIFSFFEGLMEVLHRENDMNFLRRSINKFFPIWVFKLLPDEFKEDVIDFRIKSDMILTKTHFEYATDSQKDFYIEKVLEFRELYSWEKEYEDNKYFKERGIKEGLNLKSRIDIINKEKEEHINNIFNKGIENINANDLDFLSYNKKTRRMFLEKTKDYLKHKGFNFDIIKFDGDWEGLVLVSGNEKYNNNLLFILGLNGTIKMQTNSGDGWQRFYSTNYFFRVLLNKLKNLDESLNLKSRAGDEEHNKERKEYYLKKFEEDSLGYSNESIPKDLINDREIFKEYLNYLIKHDFEMLDREFFYLNDEFKIIYLNKKKEIGKRLLPHEIRWMKKMDIKEELIFEKENINNFNIELKNNFKKINISFRETYSDNLDLYLNNKKIGTLRFYIEENWLVIDNIELYSEYIGKGIGFLIYETLYKTSKDVGLNGFFSKLFSKEINQKRSKLATKVLDKLINKYGGEKHDSSQWISDKYKNDDDVYDYLIDGRGKVEIKIV